MSDASQTSSLAWQQENVRSIHCTAVTAMLFLSCKSCFWVFLIVDKSRTFTFHSKPHVQTETASPPTLTFSPGRVAGAVVPWKLETLHCSHQPLIVLLVPHQGQNMPVVYLMTPPGPWSASGQLFVGAANSICLVPGITLTQRRQIWSAGRIRPTNRNNVAPRWFCEEQ